MFRVLVVRAEAPGVFRTPPPRVAPRETARAIAARDTRARINPTARPNRRASGRRRAGLGPLRIYRLPLVARRPSVDALPAGGSFASPASTMSGALQAAAGPSSDRASVFAMGTLMGVAVAGAGALALSYYARMERERFAADARERYARASHRRHSSEGVKDASRDRAGRYRRSAGMIASAHVANMARQTSVDALDSGVNAHEVTNAHMDEYQIMAEEANDLMRASIGSLDGEHAAAFADMGDVTSSSKTDGGGGGGGGGGSGGGSGGGVVATRRVVTLNLPDTDAETDGGGIGKHRKKTHRRHSEDPNAKGSHAHDGNLSRSTPSQRNTRGAQGAHWVPRSPSTAAVKDGVIEKVGARRGVGHTEFTEGESGATAIT